MIRPVSPLLGHPLWTKLRLPVRALAQWWAQGFDDCAHGYMGKWANRLKNWANEYENAASMFIERRNTLANLCMWARLSVRFTYFLQILGYSTSLRPNTFYKICLGVITALKHFWLESKEGRALFLTFRHLRMATFAVFSCQEKRTTFGRRVDGVRAFKQLNRFIATLSCLYDLYDLHVYKVMYAGSRYEWLPTVVSSLHVCAVDLSYFPCSMPFR